MLGMYQVDAETGRRIPVGSGQITMPRDSVGYCMVAQAAGQLAKLFFDNKLEDMIPAQRFRVEVEVEFLGADDHSPLDHPE